MTAVNYYYSRKTRGVCVICQEPTSQKADGTRYIAATVMRPLPNLSSRKCKIMNEDLKTDCHFYLDKLWSTPKERRAVYRWLAFRLRIPRGKCHISMMSTAQLYKARHILRQEYKKRRKRGME